MENFENNALYALLRMALDPECRPSFFPYHLNEIEWEYLHSECLRQLLVGVAYRAICHLPKEQKPPMELIYQWASEVEVIKGQNKLLNSKSAHLTELFTAHNRKTAVLKGPANARLYPDPLLRQAGDIDLWVEGGHDSVVALLNEMDFSLSDRCLRSKHHVCLEQDENGILVEIHHKTSSGIFNLFAKKRLLRYLEREILNLEHVPEGFFVPSMKFALMMQLSHIQKHFFDEGVGLKQLTDYYILLHNSSPEDRREVSSKLKSFGLYKGCGAVMWIMEHVFGLSPEMMLVKPDKRRGMTMLAEINEGGNFGLNPRKQTSFFVNWLKRRYRTIRLFSFAPVEAALHELDYWKSFIRYTPLRIKYRKLSVRHLK
jgi:hypothetical protein